MKVIGITGGIASGKSTVTKMFAELGAQTASADEDARAVLEPGSPTLDAVFTAFPDVRNPDGTLNRSALGARIFPDMDARKALESLTHPAIIERMKSRIETVRQSDEVGLLIYEVPLLYEAGLESLFDRVVAVVASREAQAERLQAREASAGRPPLTEDAIDARLTAQLSSDEKARRADEVIRTDVPMDETRQAVARIVSRQ